ncbi:MAG: acyl-[acyl-carrier-protein] thioesterase [Lachnospiraceae bacterium]|nr:acyl-[acyl-carrier-protein] thioesterase [Lachnospiraceae bacterium]
MYTFPSRVRFSEAGADGLLTMAGVVNYFQDCSTFQSEDAGVGLDYLRARGMVWVINSWQIEVLRYPALGEHITVGTAPYDLKGFLGMRNFVLLDEQGAYLVKASSIWSLIGTETFHPVGIPQEVLDAYTLEPKVEMEYLPRKIRVPEGGEAFPAMTVQQCHLDHNHHVNNGQYITLALGYLPEDFHPTALRTEYRQQAFLNDRMTPVLTEIPEGYILTWTADDGKAYCVVEFRGEHA